MNPHFIFNALNSINAFVQRNDQDSATSYLSKFARVMRSVLENSRHAEVPLVDDLETLRWLYGPGTHAYGEEVRFHDNRGPYDRP
ncbi:MAG: histidine kinase [Flavobacteriales bacterium]|nr:histidine kinase [Flavobacteriales bacterium]